MLAGFLVERTVPVLAVYAWKLSSGIMHEFGTLSVPFGAVLGVAALGEILYHFLMRCIC